MTSASVSVPIRLHPAPVSRTPVVGFPLHRRRIAGSSPSYPSRNEVNHPSVSSCCVGCGVPFVGLLPRPVVASTAAAAPLRLVLWLLSLFRFVIVSSLACEIFAIFRPFILWCGPRSSIFRSTGQSSLSLLVLRLRSPLGVWGPGGLGLRRQVSIITSSGGSAPTLVAADCRILFLGLLSGGLGFRGSQPFMPSERVCVIINVSSQANCTITPSFGPNWNRTGTGLAQGLGSSWHPLPIPASPSAAVAAAVVHAWIISRTVSTWRAVTTSPAI